MSYRQLLANLEALPKEERQLAGGVYYFEEKGRMVCGCVLGKGLPGLKPFISPAKMVWRIRSIAVPDSVFVGMTGIEPATAQAANDSFNRSRPRGEECNDNTPIGRRARYVHMIEWLRARVADESEAPQAPKASP